MTHSLERPSWKCLCGDPWPCEAERTRLLRAYTNHSSMLRLTMADLVNLAIEDLPLKDIEPVRKQLTHWLRQIDQ